MSEVTYQDEWDDSCDFDDDVQTCDVCGRDINGYDSGDPCPFCCPSSYAPGSEECDWCASSDECAKMYNQMFQTPKKKRVKSSPS